jgi:hypothetical protein
LGIRDNLSDSLGGLFEMFLDGYTRLLVGNSVSNTDGHAIKQKPVVDDCLHVAIKLASDVVRVLQTAEDEVKQANPRTDRPNRVNEAACFCSNSVFAHNAGKQLSILHQHHGVFIKQLSGALLAVRAAGGDDKLFRRDWGCTCDDRGG